MKLTALDLIRDTLASDSSSRIRVERLITDKVGSIKLRKFLRDLAKEEVNLTLPDLRYVSSEIAALTATGTSGPSTDNERVSKSSQPTVVTADIAAQQHFTGGPNAILQVISNHPYSAFLNAKGSNWGSSPLDIVPKHFPALAAVMGKILTLAEKESGVVAHITHTLRSENGTNARSSHKVRNGATATDFRSVDRDSGNTAALFEGVVKVLKEYSIPFNQLFWEQLTDGHYIIHLDLKPTGRRQIGFIDYAKSIPNKLPPSLK